MENEDDLIVELRRPYSPEIVAEISVRTFKETFPDTPTLTTRWSRVDGAPYSEAGYFARLKIEKDQKDVLEYVGEEDLPSQKKLKH